VNTKPVGESFTLRELEDSGIIEDAEELRQTCEELIQYHLFAMLNRSTYKTRSKEDAVKIAGLPQDSLMLYNQIESSHTNGIWRRTLVDKTRLHESNITKGIKELISKALIKEIKLAKYPAKRVYMLAHLEPSSQDSGGNFFNDGDLDIGMIEVIGDIIVDEVQKHSWIEEALPGAKRDLKRKRTSGSVAEESQTVSRTKRGRILKPRPADYDGYLSAGSLLERINSSGVLFDSVSLSEGDVQQLLDKLEYDGRVQRMGSHMGDTPVYRSVRRTWDSVADEPNPDPSDNALSLVQDHFESGNGLTHTPCGVCPVFKDCEPGGVVSPETCEYMEAWLAF
jgi:DNA-directed RNA polymerase III subunit RPC6